MSAGACTESGCGKPLHARGLCNSHYAWHSKRGSLPKAWKPPVVHRADFWTDAENFYILDHPDSTAAEIARVLDRSERAVAHQRIKLGRRHPDEPRPEHGGYSKTHRSPHRPGRRTIVAKTCTHCGDLLDGSWFARGSGGCAQSYCRRCHSVKKADWRRQRGTEYDLGQRERLQAITLAGAERYGEPYTEDDMRILEDVSLPLVEMALRTKRTYKAIVTARAKYGLPPVHEPLADPQDSRWLIKLDPNVLRHLAASA